MTNASRDEERLRLALREEPDLAPLLAVLDETIRVLDENGVEYLLMGGIASSCLGRERWTHDIDLFTRPAEAARVLKTLAAEGFETEETYPEWLFKARKDAQLVDVIFRSGGNTTVDDEMLRRAPTVPFMGRLVRTVPPEDLVVIKAIVAAEHTPRHWYDALAIIAATELDWEYLLRRARQGVRRILSLLLYAQSNDLPAPSWVIRDLLSLLEGA
ncbi:MAG TPA: nucleotidyltransferase [Acidimicrobiales bacterium]|nr:nucleotidyltransferase [Acidimicrobiales bacterium]